MANFVGKIASGGEPDTESPMTQRDLRDPALLLGELVRQPSITPAQAPSLDVLAERLCRLGFAVHRPAFGKGAAKVANLYARLGNGRPCLAFAGHIDVVPSGSDTRWTHDPFGGEIADGFIFGRGAVDMKGGIAAMLAAVARYLRGRGRPEGSIAFLITGDEEGPAVNGTVKLLEWVKKRGDSFDHCILGEPTNPSVMGEMIKIGRRGSLTGTITIIGKQGHVAYPALADNPLHRLPHFIRACARPLDRGSAHFDASSLQFVSVDTDNPASNVIPATVKLRFNVRFNDRWTPKTLAKEIERRCRRAAAGASFDIAFEPMNSVSFLTEPGSFVDLVARSIKAQTGRTPALSTSGGTSDARFIKDCCPVIEFGLVGDTMHAVDERASIADLECLTSIYERVLAGYFGDESPPAAKPVSLPWRPST
jgi:succinyl-diaminopimelate desuccinylase